LQVVFDRRNKIFKSAGGMGKVLVRAGDGRGVWFFKLSSFNPLPILPPLSLSIHIFVHNFVNIFVKPFLRLNFKISLISPFLPSVFPVPTPDFETKSQEQTVH